MGAKNAPMVEPVVIDFVDFECPEAGIFPDEESGCEQYYVCNDALKSFRYTCNPGQLFDAELGACNDESAVDDYWRPPPSCWSSLRTQSHSSVLEMAPTPTRSLDALNTLSATEDGSGSTTAIPGSCLTPRLASATGLRRWMTTAMLVQIRDSLMSRVSLTM